VLEQKFNRAISIKYPMDEVEAAFKDAHVLHYHNCFEPEHAARYRPLFKYLPEAQRAILEDFVPVQYETRLIARLWSKALNMRRKAKHAAHQKQCKFI
jgi:hypothetical protein